MSKLDKDQVIADFTAAYEKAHGKKPTIDAKSGWYSVDGGKNMRLAQLAEEAEVLKGTTKAPAAELTQPSKSTKSNRDRAAKRPGASKAPVKTSSTGKGLTARDLWRKKLEDGNTVSRLPRGSSQ
ncbi:hypothetical protein [Pseudidiomarina insulisalsae]|uniref:Uncharacterized protein n=1 Tax=Pseudidiomarina insulisalsae TaxID=575789 RepID=A0A432YN33_9GAMM|nr:hypothetical protein [Pseudidiomarina insulisalsae]RUO62265.1 hypothetical protein CWI71_05300 [Pseudidiomarina insulisalsae]